MQGNNPPHGRVRLRKAEEERKREADRLTERQSMVRTRPIEPIKMIISRDLDYPRIYHFLGREA
jgi:hypothetical protein